MTRLERVAAALEAADSTGEGYPDYTELARVAIKAAKRKKRRWVILSSSVITKGAKSGKQI